MRDLKQSGEVGNCQTCKLIWDALRSNVKPIGEAELDVEIEIDWHLGGPLVVTFCPSPFGEWDVELDLFARDRTPLSSDT